jgi:tetratricopeptide (TPR) repeat protein
MRQFDSAIDSCDEALKLEPKNALALSIRGFAHESGGNRISALADFSNALSFSPRMPEALMYRAQHYIKSKEFHSAQRDLNDYLTVRSNDQTAKKLLATVSRKTEHSLNAADSSSSKRRKYIGIPFAQLLNTGITELNKGNTETAADMLTEAVRQNPSDATARRYLCHALVREDPKSAVVQFDALRSAGPLPPDDERSYRHALSLAATGSLVETSAIDKAMQTVAAEPGNPQACYKLSTLYAAAGMLSKAAQYCQTGLSNAKHPAETKKFHDLYQRLNKQNVQGEQKEDIGG